MPPPLEASVAIIRQQSTGVLARLAAIRKLILLTFFVSLLSLGLTLTVSPDDKPRGPPPPKAQCAVAPFAATARAVLHEGPAAPVDSALARSVAPSGMSLADCMCRCSMSELCNSFTYDAAEGACALRMRCVDAATPLVSPAAAARGGGARRTYYRTRGCSSVSNSSGPQGAPAEGRTITVCSPPDELMSNGSRPRIIWSFWNTLAVPEAVATNVFTWSARNPTYVVRLLNAQSVACYLPDDTFADIASVPLRTDLIRLALLYRYGGVWMDALNVLVEPLDAFIPWASLEAGGLYAISDATYSNPNTTDFVESWMLASCRGSPTIKRWLHLLTNLVRSNGGGVKGIISSRIYDQKTLAAYTKINALLPAPGGPTHWAEYLVICAAFTFLYHHRTDFRRVVEMSRLDETHSVGYMLQLHYNWSMSEVNTALLARMGTHPLHERLMSSRIIKVSTNNMGIINARRGVLRHILGPPPTDDSRPRHAFQLVLARYDEPLDWSNPYRGVRAIYNMGAPVPHNSRHRMDYYSERPDLSTDAEAFLAYVEDHYDLLPEYVAFSRGAIDSSFAWVRRDYGAPMFGSMLEEARRNGCSNSHAAHPDSDGEFGFRFTSSPHSGAKRRAIGRRTASNFGEFFHDVLGLQLAPGELLRVFPDGMLVVSRAHILSRSRAYYSQMRRRLGASGGAVEAPYTERSWYHIFRCADLTLQNPPPPPIDCAADFDTPTGCCGYEHVFVPEAERCPAHRPVCVDNLPGKHWGHCVERGAAAAAVDRRKPVVPIDCAGHFNHSTGCCGFSHMYVPERERCPSHLPICVDNLPGQHWGHCVTA